MKKRLLVGLATAGIIGGGVYGFAATLGVTSDNLAAGSDGSEGCDSAVTVDYEVEWNTTLEAYGVTEIHVGGIHADCDGQMIQATLTDETDQSALYSTDEEEVEATEHTFTVDGDEAAQPVGAVHVAIDGVDVSPVDTP